MAENPQRVGNINVSIIIGIRGVQAVRTRLAKEEIADYGDRIGNVDDLVFIDIAADKAGIVRIGYAGSFTVGLVSGVVSGVISGVPEL